MKYLFKLDNEVVFYKHNIDPNLMERSSIEDGSKIGYDTDGNVMNASDASIMFGSYTTRDCSNPIKANIDLSSTILSIVRYDLINLSMTDAIATLSSMQSIIFMVQLGLFVTAATLLDSTTRTDILTDELLNNCLLYTSGAADE